MTPRVESAREASRFVGEIKIAGSQFYSWWPWQRGYAPVCGTGLRGFEPRWSPDVRDRGADPKYKVIRPILQGETVKRRDKVLLPLREWSGKA